MITKNHLDSSTKKMYYERQPPARIMAAVTLFASTLDVLADIIMSFKLGEKYDDMTLKQNATLNPDPESRRDFAIAQNATIAYWVFVVVAVFVYCAEMVDIVYTLKHGHEKLIYARIAKSMVIALEEVPLPICVLIIYTHAEGMELSMATFILGFVKLIALTWGITKFMKLHFCWFCLPCTMDHGWSENVRRCFTFKPIRIVMLLVNICHVISIIVCILMISASAPHAHEDGVQ